MFTQLDRWPPLPVAEWADTYATLHMWTQVVGKIRLALAPPTNHWWEVTLYLTARGLTTSPMPYGDGSVEIAFDFIDHLLTIETSDGRREAIPLRPQSVAAFYHRVMAALHTLGINVRIWPMPVEVPSPIRFDQDEQHASYDREYANRWWRAASSAAKVMTEFRSRFIGKSSPVHFFWGSFDLAVTRFSGRRAPAREGADPVTAEAYSHEVISHGFWPGGAWPGAGTIDAPIYYSYTVPEPAGLRAPSIRPAAASFNTVLSEFVLPYDDVRRASSPREALLEFLQSTYDAGADLAGWEIGRA